MMRELKLIIEPDADEPGTASVYVDGSIDGRAYRFLLDTGAAQSSIQADDYTSMLASVGTHHSSGVFAASSSDQIVVPRIAIGPMTQENFTLTREASSSTANLVGMDLLRAYRLHFLFDDNRVLVDEDGDAYGFEPLLTDAKYHPYVQVGFGSAGANAVWDTGASLTVVDMRFIDSQPAFFAAAGHSTGTDATGAQVETPMFIMSSAVIGGRIFPPHRVAGVDLSQVNAMLEIPMDMIVGYGTFSRANWLFDFPRKRWAITRWLAD